jgi:hypothetical protein
MCSASSSDPSFPLLMPHVHPESAESYLCTPIKLDEERTHYIRGFRYKTNDQDFLEYKINGAILASS